MRKFSSANLPDANDRTPNTPAIFLTADEALAIYNDIKEGVITLTYKNRVDEEVAIWLHDFLIKECGWSKVTQYGTTFLLVADVALTGM